MIRTECDEPSYMEAWYFFQEQKGSRVAVITEKEKELLQSLAQDSQCLMSSFIRYLLIKEANDIYSDWRKEETAARWMDLLYKHPQVNFPSAQNLVRFAEGVTPSPQKLWIIDPPRLRVM